MNLFHYYTYYKSLKNIDRAELSITCVFLACKIRHGYIKLEELENLYNGLKPNNNNKSKQTSSDANKLIPKVVNVEMELLNFLEFDLDIEIPYRYYFNIKKKYNFDNKTDNLIINIINDSFRRPLCIYFHPKTIALVASFIGYNISNEEEITMEKFLGNENQTIKDEFADCFDILFNLFEIKLNIEKL